MDDHATTVLEPGQPQHYRAGTPHGSGQRKRDMPHRRLRLPAHVSRGTDRLAELQRTSWQEIVRKALEAYVPAELLEEGGSAMT